MNHIDQLTKLRACSEAVEYAAAHPTLQAAWDACKRGDWMLWLLGKLAGPPESESRHKLVLAACQCARLALPHVKQSETRPLAAIETAERWARGEDGVTLAMVRAAANAADAAYAAANAADAADAAAALARSKTLARCAEIVREAYPQAPEMGKS